MVFKGLMPEAGGRVGNLLPQQAVHCRNRFTAFSFHHAKKKFYFFYLWKYRMPRVQLSRGILRCIPNSKLYWVHYSSSIGVNISQYTAT